MAYSENLLVIFISLELLSLSLYIMTAFNKQCIQSAEAALKYFLFGGMSAAFMLFDTSMATITVASRCGVFTVAIGRAMPTRSTVRAAAKSPNGAVPSR